MKSPRFESQLSLRKLSILFITVEVFEQRPRTLTGRKALLCWLRTSSRKAVIFLVQKGCWLTCSQSRGWKTKRWWSFLSKLRWGTKVFNPNTNVSRHCRNKWGDTKGIPEPSVAQTNISSLHFPFPSLMSLDRSHHVCACLESLLSES